MADTQATAGGAKAAPPDQARGGGSSPDHLRVGRGREPVQVGAALAFPPLGVGVAQPAGAVAGGTGPAARTSCRTAASSLADSPARWAGPGRAGWSRAPPTTAGVTAGPP